MTVPLFTSPGRSGFGPSFPYPTTLGLATVRSGLAGIFRSVHHAQNGKGLPKYFDAEESDIFILSGAEDLVPILVHGRTGGNVNRSTRPRASPATCAALSATDRRLVCAHRAMDRQDDRHQPLALHFQGQCHDPIRQARRRQDRRPSGSNSRLHMDHLRKL